MQPVRVFINAVSLGFSACLGFVSAHAYEGAAGHEIPPPFYTAEQAQDGAGLYGQKCASCHGAKLNDGSFAPPLIGDGFYSKWGGRSVASLLDYVKRNMPPGLAGELTPKQYLQIIAYMFQENGFPSGKKLLSTDHLDFMMLYLPLPENGAVQIEEVAAPPPPEPYANPLESITQVSDKALKAPVEGDWLMWRRTYDAQGFSPLKQINTKNVHKLTLAWAWSLPQGRSITAPLVHDGVMFMYAGGGTVQALDAKSGNLLWQYERKMEKSVSLFGLRGMAMYQDMVIFPAGDGHVVALDMVSGKVVWDTAVVDPLPYFSGGPIVANGHVLLGTSSATLPGHNFIVSLDAETGEEKWRFHTVALPGEKGAETWNNLSAEERSGAGVWVPASYDAKADLVFFGTGNTYNTAPMRTLAEGAASNDGLYMNSTLALRPATGDLVWYYQHLPNDQWNYDWAFERIITEASVKGKKQRIVLTGGKPAIFDAMQVENGKYLFSFDMGLQTVVEAIDPETGEKHIARAAMPEEGEEKFVCPSSHGNRNWMPTALQPRDQLLYVPFLESCMKVRPPQAGDFVVGGLGQKAYPRPDSDGRFGGLKAIDLKTGKARWTAKWRAVPTTGVLTTAGDLVFVGAQDRMLRAYNTHTGEVLWQARLNDMPGGGPISYSVNGKQYIAVSTGHGEGFSRNIDDFIAREIKSPAGATPVMWVFELP